MALFKFALRTLVRSPSVTAIAVISLALGIGGNVAIFSVFNNVLIRSLPVADPGRLVNLGAPGPNPGSVSCNNAGSCEEVFSYPMFEDLAREQSVFTGIAAHRSFDANLAYEGQTENAGGIRVSGSYFGVLGLTPALGRLLGPDDTATVGESPVVVLSHGYWTTHFGAEPGVLGRTLIVNGRPMTVVGVAPEGFTGTIVGTRPEVFVPITMRNVGNTAFEDRKNYWVYLFARLRPGVSIEQVRVGINLPYSGIIDEVEAELQEGMSEQTMARFRQKEVTVEPGRRGQSSTLREAQTPLLLLLGVTGFVILIACANVANLLLSRSSARAGEMALRLSVGANRRQLVGQLLAESCLLGAAGGLAGLAVAGWTLDLIIYFLPPEDTAGLPLGLDEQALLFAAILGLGTGVVSGLFPALQSVRGNTMSTLKGRSAGSSASRTASRFRSLLVTAQIGLSMALLVAAGLFMTSLVNLTRVDLGLDVNPLVTFGISPLLNGHTGEQAAALYERIEDELTALPGVTSATASQIRLLSGNNNGNSVSVEGFEAGPDVDRNSRRNTIGLNYFRTLGTPLISGRTFTAADAGESPRVAVVNRAFARKFNLGAEAVGKRMGIGGVGSELDIEIVGLVADANYSEVRDAPPPQFFLPYRLERRTGSISFYIRTTLNPEGLLGTIPGLIRRMDPNLPVEDIGTMRRQVNENIAAERILGTMTVSFAIVATLLAMFGLYGTLAYSIAQRTREIGLRMALGADQQMVRVMVLRQVAWMALGGIVLGVGMGVALTRVAQSLLFEVEGQDPLVMAGAATLLAAVTLAAGLIPAHRASGINPNEALRYE